MHDRAIFLPKPLLLTLLARHRVPQDVHYDGGHYQTLLRAVRAGKPDGYNRGKAVLPRVDQANGSVGEPLREVHVALVVTILNHDTAGIEVP